MELNFMMNKEEKLKSAFQIFDQNGDGKIDVQELKEVLGSKKLFP
jgi:Ca2+-binding EF-hand superfamily protein